MNILNEDNRKEFFRSISLGYSKWIMNLRVSTITIDAQISNFYFNETVDFKSGLFEVTDIFHIFRGSAGTMSYYNPPHMDPPKPGAKFMLSQVTCYIEPAPEFRRSLAFSYKVKIFRPGKLTLQGVHSYNINDIIEKLQKLADHFDARKKDIIENPEAERTRPGHFVTFNGSWKTADGNVVNTLPEKMPPGDVTLLNVIPKMVNYRFRIKIPRGHCLDLGRFKKCFTVENEHFEKAFGVHVHCQKYNRECVALHVKFSLPSEKMVDKKCVVLKIFSSGKVNIQGSYAPTVTRGTYGTIEYIMEKYEDILVHPVPEINYSMFSPIEHVKIIDNFNC